MDRIFAAGWSDYELIDAGNGEKLERFGNVITIRPEINAYFRRGLTEQKWLSMAQLRFIPDGNNSGTWEGLNGYAPGDWQIKWKNLVFQLRTTRFKHVGIFPEQQANWDFIEQKLSQESSFLNLFAYTGCASLVAKATGAQVCHCDSVAQVNDWARSNMEASGLNDIRWICDDALKFAQRELKRGSKYDGILMDPPSYGIGKGGKRWKIEQKIGELIDVAAGLMTERAFLIINTYTPKLSHEDLYAAVRASFRSGEILIGKLSIKSQTGKVLEYGDVCRIQKKA
jgi:23S rRNA (cytosine1962-C5)-methyltransferase